MRSAAMLVTFSGALRPIASSHGSASALASFVVGAAVPVAIERHHRGSMAQALLHFLDRQAARVEQSARVEVPEVVEAHRVRQPRRLGQVVRQYRL